MFKSVSEYAHDLGKKVIWFPYTSGQNSQLQRIGKPINIGKDFKNNDLIDIAVIQPNYFYYELNTSVGDAGYKQTMNDIWRSTKDNAVKYDTESGSYTIVGGGKTTKTIVTFQIEADMSLVTGRKVGNISQSPSDKAEKLSYTLSRFRDMIYDSSTSYGVYIGGPNEQGFTWNVLSDKNDNYHSNKNFMTLLEEAGIIRFYEFKNALKDIPYGSVNDYNGKLIYDMGYLLMMGKNSINSIPGGLKTLLGDTNVNTIYNNNNWEV